MEQLVVKLAWKPVKYVHPRWIVTMADEIPLASALDATYKKQQPEQRASKGVQVRGSTGARPVACIFTKSEHLVGAAASVKSPPQGI